VAATAIEERGGSAEVAEPKRFKTLWFLQGNEYDRAFVGLLREMLGRGHELSVALERQKGGPSPAMIETLDGLREQHPGFAYQQIPPRTGVWRIPAGAIHRSLDYLDALEPDHADPDLREAAREQAPRGLRALLFLPPFRWRFGRRALGWVLRRLEAGMPLPGNVKSLIKDQAPEVVIVSPLAELGSPRGEFIRTAATAKVPSVFVVASWAGVAGERALRDMPTAILVPSEKQTEEAVRVHGLPDDRIQAMGEQSFGLVAPAATPAVNAIEGAASAAVRPAPEARILRPILWLLTPLLAILLPLLRPRATLRAVTGFPRRMRKRRAERRKLARAEKAGLTKQARAEAKQRARARPGAEGSEAAAGETSPEKRARAQEKQHRSTHVQEARQRKVARAEVKREARSDPNAAQPKAPAGSETRNGGQEGTGTQEQAEPAEAANASKETS
jgi:hypothetical protein